jgi:acyl-coenzyme A synthetase/AMP-(fatty) acid ligase
MKGFSSVPDPAVSLAHGIPISEEPGLGSLTLPGFLQEVTGRFRGRECIAQPLSDGSVERWSYDELYARAMQVARALVACGVGKGATVGILMTNRAEFVSSVFGASLAGAIAAPLSTFSTPGELDFLIRKSSCSVLLMEPGVLAKDFAGTVRALEPEIAGSRPGALRSLRFPFLDRIVMLGARQTEGAVEPWETFLAHGDHVSDRQVEARAAMVAPADAALLLFSSGTTGMPKGMYNAHRGVSIQLWRWPRIFGLDDDVRALSVNGLFWSGPFGMAIGSTLATGGTLVMQSVFQPEATLALMASERVTLPLGWAHQWAKMGAARNWGEVDLSAMKYAAAESPLSQHPTVSTDWPEPTRIYGNTETFTLSSAYASGTPEELIKGAFGFPLPGMTFKVIDPLDGSTLPTGERGEFAIKGATLMLGYLGVPLDESLDGEGFLRTGDGGYMDEEGRIYWEGRLNDIIKTGGANVSPIEIDALIIQYPGVKITQTVGVPDPLLGELVVTCVAPHDGAVLAEDLIRDFVKTRLASYKVPRRVLILKDGDFSTTGSAKVKATELRKLAAQILAREAQAA